MIGRRRRWCRLASAVRARAGRDRVILSSNHVRLGGVEVAAALAIGWSFAGVGGCAAERVRRARSRGRYADVR